ncbi:hypothetical protein B0H63DRAFT_252227 [Podospora didyma]|uniref:Uncharacterized protein n=1 Tax=Podospora didyma TaxID=330526 RepID=A0AAE0KLV2_9PEZI|nr:hypothetical protein B0H63DRAFT_252227 [Podospora didyma]
MVPALETAMSRPSSGVASPPQQKIASRSRTQSISSDRPSTIAYSLMSPPLSVSPEAAFIAASAGSQIITNDHDSHADAWYDQHGIEPSGEPATVSPGALQLVNNFLDQLLFNFLSVSRSTSLSALRPAVSEVLKPKLAKDAINQADEELREYLGGDDEDLTQTQDPASPSDWDLELVWKRTRLRCMVYSSLGDMEEEDEDFHMEQGHLQDLDDRSSEIVGPAVAIFLTSILEFMGEQALVIAGQAAYHRLRGKYEKELKEGARSPTTLADRVVVEELDMERVALDRTLGRLWRAWKKKIRSPGIAPMDGRLSHSYSRDSIRAASAHLRSPSITAEPAVPATVLEPATETEGGDLDLQQQDSNIQEASKEYLVAAAVPLPLGPNDVEEIEVPGVVSYSDDEADEDDDDDQDTMPTRPKSLMIFPVTDYHDQLTPTPSQPNIPVLSARKRSNSLPTPAAAPFTSQSATPQPAGSFEPVVADDTSSEDVSKGLEAESRPESRSSASDSFIVVDSDAEDEAKPVEAVAEIQPHAAIHHIATGSDNPPLDVDDEGEAGDDEVDDDDEEEVFIEEPQILTSSRISISGRSSSPASSEHGRPAAIITNLPVRTPSVHSARLIDVHSPRSPVVGGSRRGSADVSEYLRQNNLSRTSGGRTPPIVEERFQRVSDGTASLRPAGIYGGKSALSASDSISEAEEVGYMGGEVAFPVSPVSSVSPVSPVGASASSLPVIPEPAPMELYNQQDSALQTPRAVVHDFNRAPAPQSPTKPTTKVTILSSTTSNGSFFIDDYPEAIYRPSGQPSQAVAQALSSSSLPPPTVPERSAGRQILANTSAQIQPSTIGQVSVERSRTRSPSDSYAPRSQDSPSVVARSQHTSGSSSSSSTTKRKALRTSEESSAPSRIDVARNFEELIHSDQTIQYTLTPESMRDIDSQSLSTGSPVLPVKSRKSEDARQNGDRSRSSSVARPNDLKRSPSISRTTAPTSYFPESQRHTSNSNSISSTIGRPSGTVPRSSTAMSSRSRVSGPQARDARLPRESVAELAEFIRSTGPSGGPATSNPPSGSSPLRNAPGGLAKSSLESGRVSSSASNMSRMRLQAREAAVDYKDDNSDLIDFIRRGPPSTSGNPRIPRTVAPFRTTMDSDQMSVAVGGKAVDAQIHDIDVRSSQASTNATEYSMPSFQSSINSQSALLGRNRSPPGGNNPFGGPGDDDMPMPKRKTRRVRDPYAIDLSDEDELDEDVELTPKPKKRVQTQEESLMDFLRNVPPPPEPIVQPLSPRTLNKPKKKASAPSLMSRFTRRDNGQAGAPVSPPISSPRNVTPAVESRSLSSRAGGGSKGYIPIQVNMPSGADAYTPSYGAPRAPASRGGPPPVSRGGRVPMKRFEPREAASAPTRTSDLADFLMNSEPPPPMPMPPQFSPPIDRDQGSGFSNLFSRRKKTSVA